MPDSSTLLFDGMALGGPASSSATRDQPPLCILNAAEFTTEFRRWLSTAAYERAIYSGHPMTSAAAAINLANLYGQAGKTRPALEACARARASRIAPYTPQADWIAGYLLKSTGDVDGAIAAYRRAACFGEDCFAQQARAELARLDPEQR